MHLASCRVSKYRQDCPEAMVKIIQRMCNRRPSERYRSLEELLIDVRRQEDVSLAHVRESYARCMDVQKHTGNSFFKAVYKKFFDRMKVAETVFGRRIEEFEERQFKALENAIVGLFAFYEQERAGVPNEPNVLTQVAGAHDHSNRKVEPYFYKPFIESLIECVCGPLAQTELIFDPQCRDDSDVRTRLRSEWSVVLTPGVEYMKSKY